MQMMGGDRSFDASSEGLGWELPNVKQGLDSETYELGS